MSWRDGWDNHRKFRMKDNIIKDKKYRNKRLFNIRTTGILGVQRKTKKECKDITQEEFPERKHCIHR